MVLHFKKALPASCRQAAEVTVDKEKARCAGLGSERWLPCTPRLFSNINNNRKGRPFCAGGQLPVTPSRRRPEEGRQRDGPGQCQGTRFYFNQVFTTLSISEGRLYLAPAQKPAANKVTQNVSRMKSTMGQPSMAASTKSAVVANASASATVLASTMSNLAPLRLSSSSRR